jgi:DNA (cytosine-5)-methyltransferase 1
MKVCSLFSGCGGFDFGFHQLNYDVVYAIDNNKWACKTYRKNLDFPIICDDIEKIDKENIPKSDIIIGGFPCQGFSTSGWFKKDDARNSLYLEMLDVIRIKKPIYFIAENVMGLIYMENGKVLRYIIDDFKKIGYRVQYMPINCADYGVPQQRKRLFLIGSRCPETHEIKFPIPTHTRKKGQTKFLGSLIPTKLQKWNTVRNAIGDLENLDEPFAKGKINNVQSKYKVKPDEPSRYTILASSTKIPIHYHGSRDDEYPRRLTVRECARIQTFPDEFTFCGPISAQYRQIGNAVPPLISLKFAELFNKEN